MTDYYSNEARNSGVDQMAHRKRHRVLIVDDQVAMHQIIKSCLSEWNIGVVTASDGREAADLVRERGFDLVFIDFVLPFIGGVEVAKLLRKEEVKRGTPSASYVVGMSGNTGCREEEVSLASGMNEFISKPFEPRAIARIFERYLEALENPVASAVVGAPAESDRPTQSESDWSLRTTRPPMYPGNVG